MTMQPEELRALRGAAGLSQGQLAEAIGMSRSTISDMESGKAPIEKRTGLAVRYVVERPIELRLTAMDRAAQLAELEQGSVTVASASPPQSGRALPQALSWDALFKVLDDRYARRDG